jgi:hypothetical protein
MSITDILWLLPVLGGAALGVVFRSSALALLLGFVLLGLSFVLWGYSIDHYSNNDCQPGEPCPTGEQAIHQNGRFGRGEAELPPPSVR